MHERVSAVVDDFQSMTGNDRLQMLLEYADALPDLDSRFGEHPELLERVEECQAPVFIAVEGSPAKIDLFFSAPKEAPTTRGFASALNQALNGLTAAEILAVSDDFPTELGLDQLISPLRVRGMRGMLARIKRKTRELAAG
ncbi:SufE family protein [Aquiluna sp. KACHI24]|uniref:SufE family protein n=1 Tax=Aquiluna sp. KACHI24 TaxID=2968831 RepID=UPI002202F89A|nr:SufE family protein [Aquiluna sp. KACHI24]BDQ00338.1 cysteine desulfurization protein SufE [Aquiluna sp. KACHI24]